MRNIFLSIFFNCLTFSNFSAPDFQWIRHERDTVGLYDKFEASFWINATFENPFDPDDIDASASFTAPSGKSWTIPAFYSAVSGGGWLSRFAWLVRFSANETGNWQYTITVKDRTGTVTSEPLNFTVISSPYHGPLKVAANNRYLEHADGTPFYGVGLWVNNAEQPEVMDELKDVGINFVSYVMTPLESRASGLGRYDQYLCSLVDKMLAILEERDMQLALNIWFHSYLSETVWGGGNVRWFENPYQKVTTSKEFYRSEEAWEYQERLYRYMIARWGYSRSLAMWFIVDEVNGTDGWVSGDSLQAARWVGNVHNYLKKNDPWQHLTTGTRSGGINQWWQEAYELLDMPGREIYEAQGFPINQSGKIDGDATHALSYSYRNYQGQVNKLWTSFEKPALIPETGWDHTFYEMSMPGYLAQFHNAYWVSLASGTAMSPFWWAYSRRLNDHVISNQMLYYRRFTDEIPFSKLTNLTQADISNSAGDAYAITSDQMTFGWAVNAETDMAGKALTINNVKNGKYKLKLYHTWNGRYIENESGVEEWMVESKGKTLTFTIPVQVITGGHARYIGQDVAFIIQPAE